MQRTMAQRLSNVKYGDAAPGAENIPPSDLRIDLISVDGERHSGTPCFAGTRVPVQDLFDYVAGGGNLDSFLLSFPSVRREQAVGVLKLAEDRLLEGLRVP